MRYLNTCSKIIAAGLGLLFVLSAISSVFLVNAQNKLLVSETYKLALVEQDIYKQLPNLFARQIARSVEHNPCLENPEQCEGEVQDHNSQEDDTSDPPPYLKNLEREDWERILSQILTPEWIKSQIESALDQFFNFLDSGEDEFRITISLVELKANVTGKKGMDIIRILVDAQPPCTESLLGIFMDMLANDFSPDQLLQCRPPQDILDGLAPIMEAALDLVIDLIPNTATFGTNFFWEEEDQSQDRSREGLPINFQTIRLIIRMSPLAPILFLILLSIFGIRSLKDWFLWWGIPFSIVGMVSFAIALFGYPMLNLIWRYFILVRIPEALDPALVEIGFQTLWLVVRSALRAVAIQAGLIAIVGIIMVALGIIRKSSSNDYSYPNAYE
jgi:hypothetical protein